MPEERVGQLELDGRHLRTVLQDLMFEVRRNANEVAEMKRQSTDKEWRTRLASLHQPEAGRLNDSLKFLREQASEMCRSREERSVQDRG